MPHPILDRACPVLSRDLGTYPVPVNAMFNSEIRPSQRKGLNVNSNELFHTCNNKAKLFDRLSEIGAPVPMYVPGPKINTPEGFDYYLYDKKFENQTAVLLTPSSSHIINSYSDLVRTIKTEHDWMRSVMYKQINDFMYEVEITVTRHKQVLHREVRRDHIMEVQFNANRPDENLQVEMETVATDIALHLQADFIRVKMVWFNGDFYVTNVTTGVTEDTKLAARNVIQRMVAMQTAKK